MADDQDVHLLSTRDADLRTLVGQSIAVLGYGNLGRSVALNLRDSGQDVTVGNISDEFRALALAEGFQAQDIPAAVADADIVIVLLPDEVVPESYARDIRPYIAPGSAVCFASGYVLAHGLVELPTGADVFMVAPRMAGEEVRKAYEAQHGFFSYVSVERDVTGTAYPRLLAVAQAAGGLSCGALELPAGQEAVLDLFVEQTFGAYIGIALQTAFAVGREAGLPPEALVLELYMSGEMSRTLTGFAEKGFFAAVAQHGLTATFGGFLRTFEIDGEEMRRTFRSILDDIDSGGFAARLQQEQEEGYPTSTAIRRLTEQDNPLSDAERRVRAALSAARDSRYCADGAHRIRYEESSNEDGSDLTD